MKLKTDITGLILAGGQSSRMGQDKGLIPYKGLALVEHAIKALEPFCSELLISSNSMDYKQFNLTLISDTYSNYGPMAGVYEGLRCAYNNWILVTTCDMPNINKEAIEILISNINEKYNGIVATFQGRIQPLFACYHKRLLPLFKDCLDTKSLKMIRLIEQSDTQYVSFDQLAINHPDLFTNMNTQSDLNR